MKSLLAVLVLILPSPIFACGSAAMMLPGYWDPAKTTQQKTDLLAEVGCGSHVNYLPAEDDLIIAAVLVDAIDTDLERGVIESVLQKFHCVYAARNEPSYDFIHSFIGVEKYDAFCNVAYLERLVIVQTPSGAALRDSPGASGKRIGAIPNGAYMEVLATHGDWYEVDGKLYGHGFVHKRLVARY